MGVDGGVVSGKFKVVDVSTAGVVVAVVAGLVVAMVVVGVSNRKGGTYAAVNSF